jgi:hypothetical protein
MVSVDLTQFVGVIIGAAISAVVGYATAQITNRGHDRRLKIQLFNYEQKKEISDLHKLVMGPSKSVWEWWRSVSKYLDTFEAKAFLPPEEMAWARSLLKNVEDKMHKMYPEDAEFDEMEKQIDEQDKEQWLDSLDEDQMKDYKMQEYMAEVKRSASSHLVGAVSSLANPGSLRVTRKNRLHFPHLSRPKFRNRKRKTKQPT